MSDKEQRIIIRNAGKLNIVVTKASHTVEDEKKKVLYEKKR